MRVVLDANVLVSALISKKGSPAKIVDLWKKEEFELVVSPPILEELERVIHYPRIQKKYRLPEENITQFLRLIWRQAILVKPPMKLTVIKEDLADNRYLECALASKAQYIVSGNTHLLNLQRYRGIEILTPTAFLTVLKLES